VLSCGEEVASLVIYSYWCTDVSCRCAHSWFLAHCCVMSCHVTSCTTPCPEKRTYSFPWITLTNLNVILQFLAHIISKVRC